METCPTCREPLPPRASTGRPRKYCSARCRDDAYRERLAQQEVWQTLDDVQPVDDASLKRMTAEAVAEALNGIPNKSPEDRLAQAILETRNLAWHYRKLSRELRPDLGWRAERMGDSLLSTLRRLFTTEETE